MNPLETLGLPKNVVEAIWANETLDRAQKVDALKDLAKRVHRALMRVVHTDTAGDSYSALVQTYNIAHEMMAALDYEALDEFVEWYVTNVRSFQGRETDLEKRCTTAERQSAALLRLLPYMDWRRTLNLKVPSEVLFGLPSQLDLDESKLTYRTTFVVRCTDTGQTLAQLSHPLDDNPIVPIGRVFVDTPPEWNDGEWYGNDGHSYYVYGQEFALGAVTLIGHVPYDTFVYKGDRQSMVRSSFHLTMAEDHGQITDTLVWQQDPFWLGAVKPGVYKGYAVVARPAGVGVELALAGKLLTSRPL